MRVALSETRLEPQEEYPPVMAGAVGKRPSPDGEQLTRALVTLVSGLLVWPPRILLGGQPKAAPRRYDVATTTG